MSIIKDIYEIKQDILETCNKIQTYSETFHTVGNSPMSDRLYSLETMLLTINTKLEKVINKKLEEERIENNKIESARCGVPLKPSIKTKCNGEVIINKFPSKRWRS